MSERTEPCPRCEGRASKACAACHGRGFWPAGATFRYLDAVTITASDDGTPEPLGYKEQLTGMHGAVIGVINDDALIVYNYDVHVEGEGDEPYLLTQDMMGPRDPSTIPNCPACAAQLKLAEAARPTGPMQVAWRCEGEDCDASDGVYEFAFDYDFTVFERVTPAESAHFPSVPVKQVWAFALKFDCDLAQEDAASPVDPEQGRRNPQYLEAVRILSEHCLLDLNAAARFAA